MCTSRSVDVPSALALMRAARSTFRSSPSTWAPRISCGSRPEGNACLSTTWYRFTTVLEGCMRRLARSPSVVRITRPSLSRSRRPAQKNRHAENSLGSRSNTVSAWCGSSLEQTSPRGLCTATVIRGCTVGRTGLPLTVTLSTPGVIFCPSVAGAPLIQTCPCAISASAARREHTPASAMYFCTRRVSVSAIVFLVGGNWPTAASFACGLPFVFGEGVMSLARRRLGRLSCRYSHGRNPRSHRV